MPRTKTLAVTHRRDDVPIPIEVRPDVSATLAAGRAGEARLDVGEPEIVGPSNCADRERVGCSDGCAIYFAAYRWALCSSKRPQHVWDRQQKEDDPHNRSGEEPISARHVSPSKCYGRNRT